MFSSDLLSNRRSARPQMSLITAKSLAARVQAAKSGADRRALGKEFEGAINLPSAQQADLWDATLKLSAEAALPRVIDQKADKFLRAGAAARARTLLDSQANRSAPSDEDLLAARALVGRLRDASATYTSRVEAWSIAWTHGRSLLGTAPTCPPPYRESVETVPVIDAVSEDFGALPAGLLAEKVGKPAVSTLRLEKQKKAFWTSEALNDMAGSMMRIRAAVDGSGEQFVVRVGRIVGVDKDKEARVALGIDRMRNELDIMRRIETSLLPKFIAFDGDGRIYLFVRAKAGTLETLRQVWENDEAGISNVDVRLAIRSILRQSLDQCDVIAKKGWVHCDLKSDNILLSEDGELEFTDYNVALPIELAAKSMADSEGMHAPEHYGFGRAAPGASLDLWALGMTVIELLAGDEAENIPVNQIGSLVKAERYVPLYDRWRRNYLGQLAAGEAPLTDVELKSARGLDRVVKKAATIDPQLCKFVFERLLNTNAIKRGTASRAAAALRQLDGDADKTGEIGRAAIARILSERNATALDKAFAAITKARLAAATSGQATAAVFTP